MKHLKNIAKKQDQDRDKDERQLLCKFVKRHNFFNQRNIAEVKDEEFLDLQKCIQISNSYEDVKLIDDNFQEETFFFILKGEVNVIAKNSEIKDWQHKWNKCQALKKWK